LVPQSHAIILMHYLLDVYYGNRKYLFNIYLFKQKTEKISKCSFILLQNRVYKSINCCESIENPTLLSTTKFYFVFTKLFKKMSQTVQFQCLHLKAVCLANIFLHNAQQIMSYSSCSKMSSSKMPFFTISKSGKFSFTTWKITKTWK